MRERTKRGEGPDAGVRDGDPAVGTAPGVVDAALPPDAGVEELAQAADVLFYAMRRSRHASGQAAPGLSPAQSALLDPLTTHPELPVGRLAAAADVSVPTATRMLKQLEAKGTVTRRRSPTDERQVLTALTEDGAHQLTAIRAHLRERQIRGLSHFPPAERVQLARQLRRLAEAITDLDCPPPAPGADRPPDPASA